MASEFGRLPLFGRFIVAVVAMSLSSNLALEGGLYIRLGSTIPP